MRFLKITRYPGLYLFERSAKAEAEMMDSGQDGGGLIIKTGGTDYSTTVLNKV